MEDVTFEHLAAFIRKGSQTPQRQHITLDTQCERDLGITGEDGHQLLEAVEKRFDIEFSSEQSGLRETFHLGPNEFLFHSEGFELFPQELLSLPGRVSTPTVHPFTVGELYDALKKALEAKAQEGA
jgi:hypothetical protein